MRKTENAEVASIVFAVTTILSKVLGFARDLFLSNYFGVSRSVDTLSAALPINSIFQNIMTSAIVISLIPLFIEEVNKNKEQAEKELSNVFTVIFAVFLILSFILIIFSDNLVGVLAPGFVGDSTLRTLTAKLIDLVTISGFLWAIVGFLFGIAQSKKHFFITAITPLFANIFIILGLIFFHKSLGIYSYIVGLNVGLIIQLCIMIYYSIRYLNLKFHFSFDFKSPFLTKLVILSIPLILLQLVNYAVTLIGNRIASTLASGSIASIQYANKLRQLWVSVLTVPIATAYYPFLSEAAAENNPEKLSSIFRKSNEFALLLGIPITVISFLFANPIVKIVFERGAFNANAVLLTTEAFKYFSIGIFALMITTLSMRVLYAMREMYLTFFVSLVIAVINVGLFYPMVKIVGHAGIPLSISVGLIIEAIVFLVVLEIKTHIELKGFLVSTAKIAIASLVSGVIMYGIFELLLKIVSLQGNLMLLIKLVVAGVVFLIVYFIILRIFKVEEVNRLRELLKVRAKP
jgi:putative peptidoglycan lipid II flippase